MAILKNITKIILVVACIINASNISNHAGINTSQKISAAVNEANKPYTVAKLSNHMTISNEDFRCLQMNVFNEAGVESIAGKIAVAQVTMARKKSGRWGKKVCDVVYSKAQFSWTLDKTKKWKIPSGKLWKESERAVKQFLNGYRIKELGDSMFYHTDYIKKPFWAKSEQFVVKIDKHIFYKDA